MKILIIQTSFPGDVILATALPESLHHVLPGAELHFMVRRGNETLFSGHPYLKKIWIWDKKRKWSSALELVRGIRAEKFDIVINVQRFFMTGLMTILSGAAGKRGFDKNPLSFGFTRKVKHEFRPGLHETERNHRLIEDLVPGAAAMPALYPPETALKPRMPYIVLAPASVWFTKQWPEAYWSELAGHIGTGMDVVLLGGPADRELCARIAAACKRPVINACGKYSLLGSAGLIKGARAVVCNDSAPAHLASAVNTPTLQIYCSTDTRFGFTALAQPHRILETQEKLDCRPCSLHGRESCPLGHFRCATGIMPALVAAELNALLQAAAGTGKN